MIKQKVKLLPVAIGVKTTINIYKVLTSNGSQLCDAIENTDCCTEICCGHLRPFELQIANLEGNYQIQFRQKIKVISVIKNVCRK